MNIDIENKYHLISENNSDEKNSSQITNSEAAGSRITDCKHTDNESKLEALFAIMQDGLVVHDINCKVIQYNASALRILGLTKEQLLGTGSYDPEWKVVTENYENCPGDEHPAPLALKTGIVQKKTLGVYKRNNELAWLLVTAVPIFAKSESKPYQALITFQDITDEKKNREKLIQKEHAISRIINSLPALIGHWDESLKNTHANDAYAEYFGKTPQEIKGKHISELLGPDLYKINEPYILKVMSGETQVFEREIPVPNGKSKYVLATYLPDIIQGQVRGFFVITSDITYAKELETDRHKMKSLLLASSKMSSLGEMASGIAHEINNPLAIIKAHATQLAYNLKTKQVSIQDIIKDINKIDTTVDRIAKIIKGLLSFARDTDAEVPTYTNINKIINECLDLCREKFKKRGVEIRYNIPRFLNLKCRPIQISQILVNLINNSFDAIEKLEEQWIEIKIETTLNNIKISIIDSGRGIPLELAENIMNPFFTTKSCGKGTGLGLSISKGLAESNGGLLYLDTHSANTCFVLEIPTKADDLKRPLKVPSATT